MNLLYVSKYACSSIVHGTKRTGSRFDLSIVINCMNASKGSYKTEKRVSDGSRKQKKEDIKPFEERTHDRTYQVSLRS